MMKTKRGVVLLTLAVATISPALARADILPGPGDCQGKSLGDSCVEGSETGSCGPVTYTKTFMSPFPDAQTQTITRSYFGCRTGVAPTKATAASAAASSAAPENTDSIPTKNSDLPAPAKKSSGFCSVRDVGARSEDGTAIAMMMLGALAFLRRRS